MEVLRSITSANDRFAFDENVRIRAHCALVRAILGFHESDEYLRKSEFHLALAVLNDGEAFIEEFPMCDGKVGRIVVELRRAEILLISTGEGMWLSSLRKLFDQVAGNCKMPDLSQRLAADRKVERRVAKRRRDRFPNDSVRQADLHQRIAIIYDAMRYLERCECELRNHPKNRWWWWIYLVLRVHAAEGLFALRLMLPEQESSKVAKIIQRSVTNFVKFELDGWIKQIAMTDVFQLARILRSYRRLLAAQRLHLIRIKAKEEEIKKSDEIYGGVFKSLCQHLCSALQARLDQQSRVPIDKLVLSFAQGCLLDAQDMDMLINLSEKEAQRLKAFRRKLKR